jgi:hypothetical protein
MADLRTRCLSASDKPIMFAIKFMSAFTADSAAQAAPSLDCMLHDRAIHEWRAAARKAAPGSKEQASLDRSYVQACTRAAGRVFLPLSTWSETLAVDLRVCGKPLATDALELFVHERGGTKAAVDAVLERLAALLEQTDAPLVSPMQAFFQQSDLDAANGGDEHPTREAFLRSKGGRLDAVDALLDPRAAALVRLMRKAAGGWPDLEHMVLEQTAHLVSQALDAAMAEGHIVDRAGAGGAGGVEGDEPSNDGSNNNAAGQGGLHFSRALVGAVRSVYKEWLQVPSPSVRLAAAAYEAWEPADVPRFDAVERATVEIVTHGSRLELLKSFVEAESALNSTPIPTPTVVEEYAKACHRFVDCELAMGGEARAAAVARHSALELLEIIERVATSNSANDVEQTALRTALLSLVQRVASVVGSLVCKHDASGVSVAVVSREAEWCSKLLARQVSSLSLANIAAEPVVDHREHLITAIEWIHMAFLGVTRVVPSTEASHQRSATWRSALNSTLCTSNSVKKVADTNSDDAEVSVFRFVLRLICLDDCVESSGASSSVTAATIADVALERGLHSLFAEATLVQSHLVDRRAKQASANEVATSVSDIRKRMLIAFNANSDRCLLQGGKDLLPLQSRALVADGAAAAWLRAEARFLSISEPTDRVALGNYVHARRLTFKLLRRFRQGLLTASTAPEPTQVPTPAPVPAAEAEVSVTRSRPSDATDDALIQQDSKRHRVEFTPQTTVHLRNLRLDTTDAALQTALAELFTTAAPIDVRLIRRGTTAFAFVTFATPAAAEAALERLANVDVTVSAKLGKVKVSRYQPPPSNGGVA